MNRADRRRFDKEFSKILKKSGDACGLCGQPFQHNSQTFGGLTFDDTVVLSGDCCSRKLAVIMGSGLYVSHNIDALLGTLPKVTKGGGAQPDDVLATIGRMRAGVTAFDRITDDTMRRSGISAEPNIVSFDDSEWKSDDAAWFKKHPNRSHRLREMYPGEAAKLPPNLKALVLPEHHRLEILVRQIKEGARVRTAFCRNTQVPIPDVDEVIHAIFDMVAKADFSTGIISVDELSALAAKYATAFSAKPN